VNLFVLSSTLIAPITAVIAPSEQKSLTVEFTQFLLKSGDFRLTMKISSKAVLASTKPGRASSNIREFFFCSGYLLFHLIRFVASLVVWLAPFPNEGRDNFYAFPNGWASGQKGVVAVAPGDTDYHGGHWKFFAVTFNEGVVPYLLTSEEAVLDAEAAGDVTVTRIPENDFLCPIQK
jgi:hypothetical protein